MGVVGIYGCGCKGVHRFPHITFLTPLVSVLFYSSIPTFCSFFIYRKSVPLNSPESSLRSQLFLGVQYL